jgi:replication-associated recombination protein RarA
VISRGQKGLAERYRPALFSELVGQEKLAQGIRDRWKSSKRPTALMLSGGTGTGKTTISRILSVAVNCSHQKEFGEPCLDCRNNRSQFDIMEVNASDITGIDGVRILASAHRYAPMPPAKMRVYIIDECQGLSKAAQNMLLKPVEDGPPTTLWIFCTTSPQGIIKTLRGRCVQFAIPSLRFKDSERLVRRVIESERKSGRAKAVEDKKLAKFLEQLNEHQVFEPRLILNSLEKFLGTGDPDCVTGVSQDETALLGKYITEGDWAGLRARCKEMELDQLQGVRMGVVSYLRTLLLNERDGPIAAKLCESIKQLAGVYAPEDGMMGGLIVAALFDSCRRFSK